MDQTYEEYALLDAQIKDLETKKKALRVTILEYMIDNGKERDEHALGKFAVAKLKQWTYPEYIQELEEDLKEKMAKAESTGEATFEEKDSLKFTATKL